MVPVIVIALYLVVVAYVGSLAYRRGKQNTEDFFLASRSIGSLVFFLSIFATNMTAFAILGSSGAAYRQGIGIFGMMASSSGLIIPLTIFFIGTRIWALGKKFGHQTQVALFRDRWECSGIGTAIFTLSAVMLIPYMIVSIIGGGTVLNQISVENGHPLIPYWFGCLIVALVVTMIVFLGGMRGVVWVNIFQTILFVLFGTVAALVISGNLPGGFGETLHRLGMSPRGGALLARDRLPQEVFWSYTFIPLSSIMFPHMSIMCLSARRMSAFKNTVIAYPIAIMLTWLPCVFLGVVGASVFSGLSPSEADGILLKLLHQYSPLWLAGLLGAGIMSAVMGSDCHQILALSTMFTKDIFAHYGGKEKYGERGSVLFARAFVILATIIAYFIALKASSGIFELAVRFAFTGFAAMAPVMIAALFWKRSTKWGALASTLWVASCLGGTWWLQAISDDIARKPPSAPPARVASGLPLPARPGSPMGQAAAPNPTGSGVSVAPGGPASARQRNGSGGAGRGPRKPPPSSVPIFPPSQVFERSAVNVTIFGFLPVVPMVLGSAFWMILVSLMTKPPSKETIDRYFSPAEEPSPALA